VKSLVLAVLLAQAADAPLVSTGSLAVELKKGDVAPIDGLLLPSSSAIEAAKRLSAAETQAAAADAELKSRPPLLVLVVAGVILFGGGMAIGYALKGANP
jgi:hypothetical protein